MRYLGVLLTLVIIAIWAVWEFDRLHMTNNEQNDRGSIRWFLDHPQERADQLKWCNDNPQNQDRPECSAAVAAQTEADQQRQ